MKEVKRQSSLLESRKEVLEGRKYGELRPHGKMWGMDVFSWSNPEVEVLEHTMHAFPFPVLLVAPSKLVSELLQSNRLVTTNLNGTIIYDASENTFVASKTDTLHCTVDIQDAFRQMNVWQQPRTILLFCTEGMDAEMFQSAFIRYIDLHQLK